MPGSAVPATVSVSASVSVTAKFCTTCVRRVTPSVTVTVSPIVTSQPSGKFIHTLVVDGSPSGYSDNPSAEHSGFPLTLAITVAPSGQSQPSTASHSGKTARRGFVIFQYSSVPSSLPSGFNWIVRPLSPGPISAVFCSKSSSPGTEKSAFQVPSGSAITCLDIPS